MPADAAAFGVEVIGVVFVVFFLMRRVLRFRFHGGQVDVAVFQLARFGNVHQGDKGGACGVGMAA